MNTYALATPFVLGLLAVAVPLDFTSLLNSATDWTLRRQGLMGEHLSAQAYGSHDRQRADVYLPPERLQAPAGGWPMVVFFYGGSWRSGERADYAGGQAGV